jgi:hypothetical protein
MSAKWFNKLRGVGGKPGLYDQFKTEQEEERFKNGIVLARDKKFKKLLVKQFCFMESLDDAVKYIEENSEYRIAPAHMYEYIGCCTQNQRVWFDLDIDPGIFDDGEEVMLKVCAAIRVVFNRLYPQHDDNHVLSVFNTSYEIDTDTLLPKKFSYHIVMRDFYFNDFESMNSFGRTVKEELGDGLTQCVDPIWTKVRQMRLLGSSKMSNLDSKRFLGEYIDGKIHDATCSIKDSFISNVEGCTLLK